MNWILIFFFVLFVIMYLFMLTLSFEKKNSFFSLMKKIYVK